MLRPRALDGVVVLDVRIGGNGLRQLHAAQRPSGSPTSKIRVPSYQPGQFCLRELPPLHVVLDELSGLGLLVVMRRSSRGTRAEADADRSSGYMHDGDTDHLLRCDLRWLL